MTGDALARYEIDPERSHLWAEARSSLHPIRVQTSGFRGYVEASAAEDRISLGVPTRVEIESQRLKSWNGLLDGELQRRLEGRKYPMGLARDASKVSNVNRLAVFPEHGVLGAQRSNRFVAVPKMPPASWKSRSPNPGR